MLIILDLKFWRKNEYLWFSKDITPPLYHALREGKVYFQEIRRAKKIDAPLFMDYCVLNGYKSNKSTRDMAVQKHHILKNGHHLYFSFDSKSSMDKYVLEKINHHLFFRFGVVENTDFQLKKSRLGEIFNFLFPLPW